MYAIYRVSVWNKIWKMNWGGYDCHCSISRHSSVMFRSDIEERLKLGSEPRVGPASCRKWHKIADFAIWLVELQGIFLVTIRHERQWLEINLGSIESNCLLRSFYFACLMGDILYWHHGHSSADRHTATYFWRPARLQYAALCSDSVSYIFHCTDVYANDT
jgi:hypothetical protein